MHSTDNGDELALATANQQALGRFAWIFGFGLAISLMVPSAFFAAAISACTGLGAGILATIALLARDDVFAPYLSRWDVAAALYAASLFSGWFIDYEALQLYLTL